MCTVQELPKMKNIRLFGTQLDLSAGPVTIPQNSNGDEQIVISSFEFNVLSTINIDVQYSIDGVNFTTLYSGISNTEKRKGGFLWRKMKFTKNSGSTSAVDINYAQGISANSNTPDASSTSDAEANSTTTRTGALGYSYNGSTWDRNRSGQVAVQTSFTGFQNNIPMARYSATAPVLADGNMVPLQVDGSGNLQVNLRTHQTGEDQAADRMMTEERNTFSARITTAITTIAKSGNGVLNRIHVEVALTGTVTVYDNIVASGTVLHIFPIGTVGPIPLHTPFGTGCTLVTSAADRLTVNGR